jgi:hypothetical protein
MSTVTPTRQRVKAERSCLLGNPVHGVRPLLLTVGKNRFGYYVFPLASDFGRAFRLVKFACDVEPDGPDSYDVLLDGQRSTCECMGFLWHFHCKHVDSIAALVEGGAL